MLTPLAVAFPPGFLTAVIPRMIIPSTCLFYVRWGLIVNKPFRFVLLDGHLNSRVPLWGSVGFISKPLQMINFRLQGKDIFFFSRRGIPCTLYLQGLILFIFQAHEGGRLDVRTVFIFLLFTFDI